MKFLILFVLSIVNMAIGVSIIVKKERKEISEKAKEKSKNRYLLIMSFIQALLIGTTSILSLAVPEPEISPYREEFDMKKDEIILGGIYGGTVYYALDGKTDPKDGAKYTEPIKLTELPATISARTKWLFKWSDKVVFTYRKHWEAEGNNDDASNSKELDMYPIKENIITDSSSVSDVKAESYEELPSGVASGWGDSGGGRESHTIEEINEGILGNQIIFNTISDSTIGSEKNFVGARIYNGINKGQKNVWNSNLIEVKEDEIYIIRIYCHNNSPNGYSAVAENVEAYFHVPVKSGKTIVVHGMFRSSNANPSEYWDGVVLTSDKRFHLEYISGSALMENNGIGSGGIMLDDQIVNGGWTRIGYDGFDGRVPGCYKYASYITIKVKPVFEE